MACSLLFRKLRYRFLQQVRNGYIVLLPEVGSDSSDKNPLFKSSLPDIENLTTEKCATTLGSDLLDFEHSVREIDDRLFVASKEGDGEGNVFEQVVEPLENANLSLESTWGLLKALHFVDNNLMPTSTYKLLHERARRARSLKYNSSYIYKSFKNLDTSNLTEEEQRLVSKFRIEGKLNGLDLSSDDKLVYYEISRKLATECQTFSQKAEISRSLFSHTLSDPTAIEGFPDKLIKAMQTENGPMVSLDAAVYPEVLEYCTDRNVRRNVWLAAIRTMDSKPELNNSATIEKIRGLRQDLAKLLGYANYAEMSMETKVAGSIDNVENTIEQIASEAFTLQEQEIEELQAFATSCGFKGALQEFDIPFWAQRQRKYLFDWDEKHISEYFPLDKVMSGIKQLMENIFHLKMVEKGDIKLWAEGVQYFQIVDQDRVLAGFYFDPYTRPSKVGGSHCCCIKPSCQRTDLPLALLSLDLPPPTPDLPCLLTFKQLETLFSKLGSVLHQLLSTVHYTEVSGHSFIEWDAVDVVSHIFSLTLNNKNVMDNVSGHYKTGKVLPVESVQSVRKHMVGYNLCHELYLSSLDLQLHTTNTFWFTVMKDLWPKFHVLPMDSQDSSPCFFTDSLVGPYSAAYFSKFWAQMLAVDIYQNSFMEDSPDLTTVGSRFRDTFLSFGGSCDPSEVFRRFQGRDPTPEAFIVSLKRNSSN